MMESAEPEMDPMHIQG